jgi:hypothetical protein
MKDKRSEKSEHRPRPNYILGPNAQNRIPVIDIFAGPGDWEKGLNPFISQKDSTLLKFAFPSKRIFIRIEHWN